MIRLILLAEARVEALGVFDWYEAQRPGLGEAFQRALDETIRRIREAPLANALIHRDLRRALLDRFPYAVFYRVTPEVIVVVGVIHGRRHPREWQGR